MQKKIGRHFRNNLDIPTIVQDLLISYLIERSKRQYNMDKLSIVRDTLTKQYGYLTAVTSYMPDENISS